MRSGSLLFIIFLFFFLRSYSQTGTLLDKFNFTSFASDKPVITPELDSLTPKEFKSHPEYGVLPYNAPCKDCYELLQKRDETHRYYVIAGSKGKKFYQETSNNNENYYDETGALRAIDPRMKPSAEAGVYKANHQSMPVAINVPQKFASILNAGKELLFNRDVTIYIKHKDGSVTSLGQPSWSDYTAGDDGITVHNFYPGIDLELRLQQGAVKSNYRINKPLNLGDGWLVVHDNINLPKGFAYDYSYSEKQSRNDRDPSFGGDDYYKGMLCINNEAGTRYFVIASPSAFDENKENNNAISLLYQTDATGAYNMYVPIDWMNSAERSYPLIIDPLVMATSIYPQANITGSGYNATCFAGGCQYDLNVAVPAACIITDVKFNFNYQALGTCDLNQGAYTLSYKTCRSPQNATTWYTCSAPLPGICQDSLSCYADMQSCIPPPQCAAYTMPFVLTFYRCVESGAGCGVSCIIANTPWTMYVFGTTVSVTVPIQNATVCQGSCVNLTAVVDSGVAPYTYIWNPGGIAGNPACLSPNVTTTYTVIASSCGGLATDSATTVVTVFPYDNPGFNISPNPVCENNLVTLTALGNSAAADYNWLLPSSNLGTKNGAQDVNGVTYSVPGTYNIILNYTSGICIFADTELVTVNASVVPSVTITANPAGAVCPGTNVTFTANVTNGGGNPTYQWYINGIAVAGATSNSFSSSGLNNGNAVTVHIISNATCPAPDNAVSNTITMSVSPSVTPSVTITANPSGPICPGTSVTFTATPSNQGTNPGYQWYLNGNPVGTNSTAFTSTTLNNGDNITLHLLNSNAPCATVDSAVSNTIQIVTSALISPTVNITASPSNTICPGTNVIFTATLTNGGAAPAYQWYLNGVQVGTNSNSFSSSTLNNGDVIDVHLLNAVGPCISPDSAVSNTIQIIYSAPLAPAVSISAAPSNTICPGTNVTFTATITNGGATPAYQWYLNGNQAGTNSSSFSSSTLNNGDVIEVHLLNATGPCISPDSAVSNTIQIIYSAPIAPTVGISGSPSNTICPGTNVTFTATITNGGATPAYQWYLNGNQAGTNSSSFSSSTLNNGDVVEVHLLNATGPCISPDSAVSNTITIIYSPSVAPTVSISAAPSTPICPGTNVTFTATITNGGATPAYQWYLNGNPAGTNSATFSSTTLNNGDVINVHLINAVGPCISPDSAVSSSFTIVYSPPVVPTVSIAALPSGIICQGQTVTFSATITGGGTTPSYQWSVNSGPQGTNSATFSSSVLNNGDIVSLVLTSNDPCASPATATSNQITIQEYPPMTVIANGDTTICPGESAPIISVAAGGEGAPYTYSWSNGGGNDSNATVNPATTTMYTVSATDACGSTPATANVTVTVLPVPVPNFSFNPSEPTEYSRTVYFTDASTGAVTWNWNFGDPNSSNDSSSAQNPNHNYSGVGTYTVELVVSNAAGCRDSISYTVDVSEEYTFYIPNAFTPNGDGINDYFAPQGTHDLIYEMTIYNRWGDKVFETINTSLPWNGTMNGSDKIAEAGVYIYRVKFVDSRYTSDVIVGAVTLVR